MIVRKLTPYEHTHVLRYKPQLISAVEQGEFGEMPIEYVTGKVEFAGMILNVSKNTLIPRVETEELALRARFSLQQLAKSQKTLRVVDVGTGSGALGLAVWRQAALLGIKQAEFYLLDISKDALVVAKQNYREVRQELLASKKSTQALRLPPVTFLQSDLLTAWPHAQPISLLLANLPYIPTGHIITLDNSVKKYEPLLALDGGIDGLVLINCLLKEAESMMEKRGIVWLEVDDSHSAHKIMSVQSTSDKQWKCEDAVDGFAKMRFVRCRLESTKVKK